MKNLFRISLLAGMILAIAWPGPAPGHDFMAPEQVTIVKNLDNAHHEAILLQTACYDCHQEQTTAPAAAAPAPGKLSARIAGRLINCSKDYGLQGPERRHRQRT